MHRRAHAGSRYEYATRWLPTAPPVPGASGNRSRSRPALAQRPHPPRPRRLASMRRRRTSATGPRTARGGVAAAVRRRDCREHDDLRALYHHASGHPSVPDAFSHTHSFHTCTGVKGRHASSTRRSGRRRERKGGDEGCLVGCRGTSSKLGPLADHTIRARPSPSRVSTGRAITLELLIARNHRMWISCCSTTECVRPVGDLAKGSLPTLAAAGQ